MDEDVITHHLMRVGSSFYTSSQFETDYKDFSPISRFGIGILTCFMVSDNIEIVTCKDGVGHRIRMTSVHSQYLLCELHPGDQALKGIEPHGTRVTARLRGTVDFSERSVEEILRYWVVLPECSVYFEVTGKPRVRIGFDSVQDAVRSWLPKLAHRQLVGTVNELEVRTDMEGAATGLSRRDGTNITAQYEVGYAVRKGWTPEWSSARADIGAEQAVCIEGIRVADQLPWFGSSRAGRLAALLSVRGDRAFRTTVSRSGLESDSDFDRVGLICGQLLFRHVLKEVTRISDLPGRPLSQAASAAHWLSGALRELADCVPAVDLVKRLMRDVPQLVLEGSTRGDAKSGSPRVLVSPAELEAEPAFWTVESRLVDYVGVISRDLGREFGVEQLLRELAPDLEETAFTPFLADADLAASLINSEYTAECARYSRRRLLTAIRWRARQASDHTAALRWWELADPAYQDAVLQWQGRPFEHRPIEPNSFHEIPVSVVDIDGDDDVTVGVVTGLRLILKTDSKIAAHWMSIRDNILRLVAEQIPIAELDSILSATSMFVTIMQRGMDEYRYQSEWSSVFAAATDALRRHGCTSTFPRDMKEYLASHQLFSAARSWLDWKTRR